MREECFNLQCHRAAVGSLTVFTVSSCDMTAKRIKSNCMLYSHHSAPVERERERLNSHSEKTKFQMTLQLNLQEVQAQHM